MENKRALPNTATLSEHVVAFDYGLKYIGCAVGNTETMSAQPLRTIACKEGQADWQAIDKIVGDWQPCRFVVGYPAPDSQSEFLKQLDSFINRLHARFDLPVDTGNEYLSSVEAYHRLKTRRVAGEIGRIARSDIDKEAAALILESWFETRPHTTGG